MAFLPRNERTPAGRAAALVAKYGIAEAQRRAYASNGAERYRTALLDALREIEMGATFRSPAPIGATLDPHWVETLRANPLSEPRGRND